MSGAAERSRSDELTVFRWIASRLSPRTRLLVASVAVLALAARLLAIAAAWLFVENDTRGAFIVAAVSAGAYVVRRAVTASARIDAESDLHLAASRAVLESDVIDEPEVEPHFALTNGLYYAVEGVTGSLPALAADLVGALAAAIALAAKLGSALSTGLALVGSAAVVVVVGMTLLVRRRIATLHEGAIAAQQVLGDALATALHGRLEIVASANEPATLDRVASAAAAYRRYAKRAAFGAAVIGRAPLGAALVLCVVALGLEQGSRSWVTLAPSAALVAASLPPLMGVVFGSQELLRLTKRLAPFGRIVLRPIRPELTRRSGPSRSAQVPRPFTLERVGFRYHDGAPLVLESLQASWLRGVLVLRGPNGCGKSTALRLLVGLREPTSGDVRLDDVDLRQIDLDGVRARVAYLPQRPYLGESYATLEEAFRVVAPEVTADEARRALARVGLEAQLAYRASDLLTLTVGELSVGQRQRLALARVLVREADVVLLDEPDANLDSAGLDILVEIVHELEQQGRMIAVAAHGPIATRLGGSAWEFEGKAVRQR